MPSPAFEPGRLRLARELRSLSQTELAAQAEITGAAVSQFESGATRPTQATIEGLAVALKVPTEFFGLPDDETHEGFFRSLRRTTVTDRRRARAIAHIAHDVVVLGAAEQRHTKADIPRLPASGLETSADEMEKTAAKVRQAWRVPAGPIQNVVGLVEGHGIVVIRLPLDSADVDAFSLPFADHPVVVLGSDKNDRARSRFDASHELGHLVVHGDEVWGLPQVERQAHEFAAAFLMPKNEIQRELPNSVDWGVLFELKRKWQVSLAALLMRARTLGRMSEGTYLTAIKAASARGWRRVEPVAIGEPERPELLSNMLRSRRGHMRALPDDIVATVAAELPGPDRAAKIERKTR